MCNQIEMSNMSFHIHLYTMDTRIQYYDTVDTVCHDTNHVILHRGIEEELHHDI